MEKMLHFESSSNCTVTSEKKDRETDVRRGLLSESVAPYITIPVSNTLLEHLNSIACMFDAVGQGKARLKNLNTPLLLEQRFSRSLFKACSAKTIIAK